MDPHAVREPCIVSSLPKSVSQDTVQRTTRKPAESVRRGDRGAWPAALSVRDRCRANRSEHRMSQHGCVGIVSHSRSLDLAGGGVDRRDKSARSRPSSAAVNRSAAGQVRERSPSAGTCAGGRRSGCRTRTSRRTRVIAHPSHRPRSRPTRSSQRPSPRP